MVEYWHWASIAGNQETYWKGILSHDLEPNRAYAEMSRTAHELEKIGPHLVGLKIHNRCGDPVEPRLGQRHQLHAVHVDGVPEELGRATDGYDSLVQQIHRSLYDLNVGTDFVFPETKDFSAYKLLIVPALYISDDALLQRISDYVKNGGHVVMTFKSGFANENSAVRWVRAPGPLREAAGFSYQEFSNLEKPLALKGDPFHVGDADNKANLRYWAEFLMPEHAKAMAFYDHPFFGKWPAITENQFGSGTLLYEGTYPLGRAAEGGAETRAAKSRADGAGSAVAGGCPREARREPHGQADSLLLQLLGRRSESRLRVRRGNEPAGREGGLESNGADARAVGSGNCRGEIARSGKLHSHANVSNDCRVHRQTHSRQ